MVLDHGEGVSYEAALTKGTVFMVPGEISTYGQLKTHLEQNLHLPTNCAFSCMVRTTVLGNECFVWRDLVLDAELGNALDVVRIRVPKEDSGSSPKRLRSQLHTSLFQSSEAAAPQLQEFRHWFPSEGLLPANFVIGSRETCLGGASDAKVALRWLSLRNHLKQDPSVLSKLAECLKMRRQDNQETPCLKKRRQGNQETPCLKKRHHDNEETPEYPLLLRILQQAVSGQSGIKVERLARAANRGEVITVVVEGNKGMPVEVKPVLVRNTVGDAWSIVEANCAIVSQEFGYLKESSINTGSSSCRGMIIRAQFLFVIQVVFNEWHRISQLRITPNFPSQSDKETDLLPLYNRAALYHTTDVDEVMGLEPSPGFVAAVQTLEELCQRPIAPLAFYKNDEAELDIAVLPGFLHNGRSSVVVPCVEGRSTMGRRDVLKISSKTNIMKEVSLHNLLDMIPGIRKMVDYGRVEGCGDGMWFLRLEECGQEFVAEHVKDDARCMDLANQAGNCLEEVHYKGCLHRDIKPQNMVIIGDRLKLNDFDLSCVKGSLDHSYAAFAGTRFFAAPGYADSKGQEAYEELDDWVSLALSFLYLKGVYADPHCWSESKICALQSVESAAWAPAQLKVNVRQYLTRQ